VDTLIKPFPPIYMKPQLTTSLNKDTCQYRYVRKVSPKKANLTQDTESAFFVTLMI
jgi:hypothetical protein